MTDMLTKNCPNCANRQKLNVATHDSTGGDYWTCTAKPVLPEFAGVFVYQDMKLRGGIGMPINLNLFKEPAPTAAGLNARTCPLFTAINTGDE